MTWIEKAVEIHPDRYEAHMHKAFVHGESGDNANALLCYEKVRHSHFWQLNFYH